MGHAKLYAIMEEKDAIYAKADFSDEDGMKAAELEGEFAEMNGWEAESDAAELLIGLGIPKSMHELQMKELSGNEKIRVLLAKPYLAHQTSCC
jgi:ATPase subunit of ABC transporter with duplicated ATPase domains